ncbi:hypothetical protein BH11PSE2_BH11PSE2_16570 [soil metagenome]
MRSPSARLSTQRPGYNGNRFLLFGGVIAALITAAGLYAFFHARQGAEPSFNDMPEGWFERPVKAEPATWRFVAGAPTLTIEADSAEVSIILEARDDIAIGFQDPALAKRFKVGPSGRDVTLTRGEAGKAKAKCEPDGGQASSPSASAPIVIRAPLDLTIRSSGDVSGDISAARNLMLTVAGCGHWKLAGAEKRLWLASSSPAQITAQSGGDVRVHLDGKGAVSIAKISKTLDASLKGAGQVAVRQVIGVIDAEVWGPGRVDVKEGYTGKANLFLKGAGSITDMAATGGLNADAHGGGKITVGDVHGVMDGRGDVVFVRK